MGVTAQCAAGLSGYAPCRLCRHGHSASIHSRLRACGTARLACLQGKALRAIPAARCLAPLDTAEPAMPDRPGQRPAAMDGALANTPALAAAGCANACRPQRWRFVSITSTNDGSRQLMYARPVSLWSFHATPQDRRRKVRRGVLACRRGVDLARVRGRAGAAFVRGCRLGPVSFRSGSSQGVLVLS